ncbi:excinuclease ABC subunit B, partial [Pseudomonas aeruginosa]|nr:excinuclease ABC subunit B [Pseudomonas aeruginosa]
QYDRTERTLKRATFRVQGDVIDIFPADSEHRAVRVELLDDTVASVQWMDPVTGKTLGEIDHYLVSPKTLFAPPTNKIDSASKKILADMEERVDELNRNNRLVE